MRATRRRLLLAAGSAAAGGSVGGFPTVWAQNIKDVTLVHMGGVVSAINAVGIQATKDLGFTIRMLPTDGNDMMNRFLTQPDTIDIADIGSTSLRYLVGRGVFQAVPVKRYKYWDTTLPMFTRGEYPDGRKVSTQGVSPFSVQFYKSGAAEAFATEPTEWLTGLPTLFNADTLGIRPDLIGRPIESWAELLNPQFKGHTALSDTPTLGIMDTSMALEARGDIKYGNKGNMTRAEIDKTMSIMLDLKRSGQFRAFWSSFDQSVNLMAAGEVVIQSMISPAVTAVRTRGIPCTFQPLKEGYRGWSFVMSPMKHLSGLRLDCFYEYANWYLSGWQGAFIARQGYYSSVPQNTKPFMTENEWGYWMEGKPAVEDIHDPFGKVMEKAGRVRDGGAFWQRVGNIACWNSIMDEDRYLTRRWNEFVTT